MLCEYYISRDVLASSESMFMIYKDGIWNRLNDLQFTENLIFEEHTLWNQTS